VARVHNYMVDKAQTERHTEATSKEVGAPYGNEIEMTPQMIEAGWNYLNEWPEWPNAEAPIKRMLEGLYRAMAANR
jgi:hypothetical protein